MDQSLSCLKVRVRKIWNSGKLLTIYLGSKSGLLAWSQNDIWTSADIVDLISVWPRSCQCRHCWPNTYMVNSEVRVNIVALLMAWSLDDIQVYIHCHGWPNLWVVFKLLSLSLVVSLPTSVWTFQSHLSVILSFSLTFLKKNFIF